jgi:hypothetical protein
VTLEISTFYRGLPHGIAFITHTDPLSKVRSFRGVGAFVHGKLHNAPFTCVRGDGERYSYSNMQNGRPADGSMYTYFYPNETTQFLDSLKAKTDVSGWQKHSLQVDKESRNNGKGKIWNNDGSIYIGIWKDNERTEGKKYELQEDGTHSLSM